MADNREGRGVNHPSSKRAKEELVQVLLGVFIPLQWWGVCECAVIMQSTQ